MTTYTEPSASYTDQEGSGGEQMLLAVSRILWKYVMPTMMFTGLVGNALSFGVMMGRRFRKQTIAVYFCVLAAADSYSLMNSLPRFWWPIVTGYDPVAASDLGCRISTFSLYFSYQLSSWVLVCVTVERGLSVAFPLKTKDFFTRRKAVLTLLVVFFILFAYNSYILFYKEGYLEELLDGSVLCSLNVFYTKKPFFSSHLWIDVLLCSVIPFIVIIISNIVIVRKVIASRKLSGGSNKNVATPSVKMLLAVSSMFIFFTLPTSIMLLYMQIYQVLDVENDGVPSLLWACALLSLYGNNSLNFFLYCITGRTFRRQIADYFCRCKASRLNSPKSAASMTFSNHSLRSSATKNMGGIYVVPLSYISEESRL